MPVPLPHWERRASLSMQSKPRSPVRSSISTAVAMNCARRSARWSAPTPSSSLCLPACSAPWARLRSLRIAISEVRHLIGGLPHGPLQFIAERAEPIDNRAIIGYRATTRSLTAGSRRSGHCAKTTMHYCPIDPGVIDRLGPPSSAAAYESAARGKRAGGRRPCSPRPALRV